MTPKQFKQIETWIVLAAVAIAGWLFIDNTWVVRGLFVAALLYVIWNRNAIRAIEQVGPTPKEVILNNSMARTWVIVIAAIEIVLAFGFLFSGHNLGDYVDGFWLILLIILSPIALPLWLSQVALFRRLGNEKS